MTITWRSSSSGDNFGSAIRAVATPAGMQPGDLLVATVNCDSTPFPAPGGFTLRASLNSASFIVIGSLGTKIAGPSEPPSWSFGTVGGSFINIIIDCYSVVDQITPLDVAVASATGTAANVAFPSITSVTDHAMHYASYLDGGALSVPTAPTGYAARVADAAYNAFGFDKAISPAGLVSGIHTTGGGTDWVAFSLMMRPGFPPATPFYDIFLWPRPDE